MESGERRVEREESEREAVYLILAMQLRVRLSRLTCMIITWRLGQSGIFKMSHA